MVCPDRDCRYAAKSTGGGRQKLNGDGDGDGDGEVVFV